MNTIHNAGSTKCLLFCVAIGLMTVVAVQCTDAPFKPIPNPDRPLLGSWSWRLSCGGIGGWCIYADSVDYTRTISFTNDYDFIEMRNDSIVFSSTYEVVRKPFWGGTDTSDVLVIEGYWIEMKIEQLRNDSLSLVDRCDDCFGHLYTKLGDI